MEESELEEWFAQERERLEAAYQAGAEAKKDPEKLRATFDGGFRKLVRQYQEKQAAIYAHERRRMALQKPLVRFREQALLLRRSTRDQFRLLVQRVRTALFHWRVRRAIRRLH